MPRSTIRHPTRLLRRVALLALVTLAAAPTSSSMAQSPSGEGKFPLVVQCTLAGTERFYYLATIKPDGRAVYMSPDHFAATITVTGTATTIAAKGDGSCAGKTIEELKKSGHAFNPE